jgi:hypothetical protein
MAAEQYFKLQIVGSAEQLAPVLRKLLRRYKVEILITGAGATPADPEGGPQISTPGARIIPSPLSKIKLGSTGTPRA